MKATFFGSKIAGVILVGLAVVCGGCKSSSKMARDDDPAPVPVTVLPAAAGPAASVAAPAAAPMETPPPMMVSGSPASPSPSTPALTPAAEQIVKLAQSGMTEDVLLAYAANSSDRFNLGSDQIIYLNDLGVPQTVIKGMIQRDTVLAGAANPVVGPTVVTPPLTPEPTVSSPPPPPAYITDQPVSSPPPPDYYAPAYSDDNGSGNDYSTPDASSDYFRNSLSPYGAWVDVGGYGPCWQPTVGVVNQEWQPYCDGGRWIDTDRGWYWQSDYSWGWAAFHYGRWLRDGHWGWVWRPDSAWGPAWVSWRRSPEYCGWAPLPPGATFVPGIGYRFHNHPVGFDFDFGLGVKLYTFVPLNHFAEGELRHHRVDPRVADQIFHKTTVVNNVTDRDGKRITNHGIDPRTVAAASHQEIHTAVIQDLPANGGSGAPPRPDHLDKNGLTLGVWRPQLPVKTAGNNSDPHNGHGTPVVSTPMPKPQPLITHSPVPIPANNHLADPNNQDPKHPGHFVYPPEDPQPQIVQKPRTPVHTYPPEDPQPQIIAKPRPHAPVTSTPTGAANGGRPNPSAQPANPSAHPATPPLFRNADYGKQPQPTPVVTPTPAYPKPTAAAIGQEPARPVYIVPAAPAFNSRPAPAYAPPQSIAPAHVAPPSTEYSGNHQYQPSYSPPPAVAAPPVYHAPPMAPAPVPVYHAPAVESHPAPAPQPPSSTSSQSSSKNR